MRTRDILFLNLHRLNQPNPALHGDFVGLYIMAAFLEDNGYEARVFAGGLSEGLKTISYEFGGFKVRAIGLYCDYENIDEDVRTVIAKMMLTEKRNLERVRKWKEYEAKNNT